MHPTDATFPQAECLPDTLVICPYAGIAYQPNPKPIDYTVDYFEKYVGYEGTPIAMALNRASGSS